LFAVQHSCQMKDDIRLIEFFLYPGATGLDIMGPLDVFSTATQILKQRQRGHEGYRTVFSAHQPGPVRLNSGLRLHADLAVGVGESPDIILLPGGFNIEQVTQNKELIDRIRVKAQEAKQIVSVCNGAFILAACGFLKGKKATTHWYAANRLAETFPDINVCPDAIYIRDGNVLTSAGVTAGIDLALSMVEEHHGASVAMDVARILVLYLRRPGSQSQFSAPIELRAKAGKRFSELHDWILKNMERPLTVESLADHAAMSPRNFSRIFTEKTGSTPGKYVEAMRLSRAREFLESGDMSMEAIAEACGFMSEERFRRAFIRQLGIAPSQYRFHFRS
jgi:transcriptional regulator GlxA family with amidase domain